MRAENTTREGVRSTRAVPDWVADWSAEERCLRAAFGRQRRDWGALWFAARWHLGAPLRRLTGRWRCWLCQAPLHGGLEDHRCAADDTLVLPADRR